MKLEKGDGGGMIGMMTVRGGLRLEGVGVWRNESGFGGGWSKSRDVVQHIVN